MPIPPAPATFDPEEAALPAPPPLVAEEGPEDRLDLEALEVEGMELSRHADLGDDLYDMSPQKRPLMNDAPHRKPRQQPLEERDGHPRFHLYQIRRQCRQD